MPTKPKIPQALPTIERRFTSAPVEIRAGAAGEPRSVRGYAAIFGQRSANLGTDSFQFYEIIQPGAFDAVLKDDVRALFNHDANLILARSRAGKGTLSLGVDAQGLWYEFTPDPEQSYARDLLVAIKRGDVDQSSFAFSLTREGQTWTETAEGEKTIALRTISKVSALYDVSPVTYPAYPDASVALRSLEDHRIAAAPAPAPAPAPAAPAPTLSDLASRSWEQRVRFL
jgi:uncharacterized protein